MATSKITNLSILDDAVRTAGVQDTAVTGAKLNDDAISSQTALGAEPADTDEFLVSDGGVLKRVDYSYIKASPTDEFRPNAQPLIYNGDMQISQRTTSTAGLSSDAAYVLDRWKYWGASASCTVTVSQDTDVPSGKGFSKSLKVDCTTAASPAAGDWVPLIQKLEGYDCQLFKYGTSDAEVLTLSFWVKSTKTGTYICNLYDGTNGFQVASSYTVDTTNTWEQKVITVPAKTSGALANSNAAAFDVYFFMVAGSNYTSGTLATTWQSWAAANVAVGQVNAFDNTANNFLITGVQLEVGSYTAATLPPFQFESYGNNLLRCQRYYQNNYRDGLYPGDSTTDAGSWSGQLYSTDFLTTFSPWTVRMRTNPTITWYTRTGTAGSWYAGVYQVNEAVDTMTTSINTPTGWNGTVSNVAATTNIAYGYYSAQAEL